MSDKTNVTRICEQRKISYVLHPYPVIEGFLDGIHVAKAIGKSCDEVFKTLVTQGKTGTIYVFMVPVSSVLDLKKAAKVVGEKTITMLPVDDLLRTTGYVKGGCSPIGMKKNYQTIFDHQINNLEVITFNAGKIGQQISINVNELDKVLLFAVAEIT